MKLIRDSFVDKMERELVKNSEKGDWNDCVYDEVEGLIELEKHVKKLEFYLTKINLLNLEGRDIYPGIDKQVSEHCADIANIAMKIEELYGENGGR